MRRKRGDLIQLYKIVIGLVKVKDYISNKMALYPILRIRSRPLNLVKTVWQSKDGLPDHRLKHMRFFILGLFEGMAHKPLPKTLKDLKSYIERKIENIKNVKC